MEWAVEFVQEMSRDNLRFIKDTLEAKLRTESGDYVDAVRILSELLIESRYDGLKQWETVTLIHMGKVYRNIRWNIALKALELALKISREIGFKMGETLALNELGEMLCSWGRLDESMDLFEKALKLVPPGDLVSRREVLLNMVIAAEAMGELERSKSFLDQVLDLDVKLKELHPSEIEEDRAHHRRIVSALEGR